MTKDEIQKIISGEIVEVYHKIKGKGVVDSTRVDKLSDNRIKAKINFTIPDLLDNVIKPEFLFLDDPNLSLTPNE